MTPRPGNALVRMAQHCRDVFQDHDHEAKMSEIYISLNPVELAIVDQERDVCRNPLGLDGCQIDSADVGAWVPIANCEQR